MEGMISNCILVTEPVITDSALPLEASESCKRPREDDSQDPEPGLNSQIHQQIAGAVTPPVSAAESNSASRTETTVSPVPSVPPRVNIKPPTLPNIKLQMATGASGDSARKQLSSPLLKLASSVGSSNPALNSGNSHQGLFSQRNGSIKSSGTPSPLSAKPSISQDGSTGATGTISNNTTFLRGTPSSSQASSMNGVPSSPTESDLRYTLRIEKCFKRHLDKYPASQINEAAKRISRAIYYNAKDRTLKFQTLVPHLEVHDNDSLRIRLIEGDLSADTLVNMVEKDLLPDVQKKAMEELLEKRRKDRDLDALRQAKATSSKEFLCTKCRNRDCSFYEMQTRSADEPMTIFITCNVCHKKWKI